MNSGIFGFSSPSQKDYERFDPDKPPANPSPYDDEFTGKQLGSKWRLWSSSAAGVDYSTIWPSWMRVRFNGNQGHNIRQPFTAEGDFSVTLKFSYSVRQNYQGVRIYMLDSALTNAVITTFAFGGSTTNISLNTMDNGVYAYDRTLTSIGPITPVCSGYLHMQRNSTNWRSTFSTDGMSFLPIHAVYSKTMTPAYVSIELSQSGSTFGVNCGIDWFRKNYMMVG